MLKKIKKFSGPVAYGFSSEIWTAIMIGQVIQNEFGVELMSITGQRKSVKVFGCIDVVSAKFNYRLDDVFNATTYLLFLEQVAQQYHCKHIFYIQDNASYHKDGTVWDWFSDNRKWIEVVNLPPYSPEFNAAEPLWKYTR